MKTFEFSLLIAPVIKDWSINNEDITGVSLDDTFNDYPKLYHKYGEMTITNINWTPKEIVVTGIYQVSLDDYFMEGENVIYIDLYDLCERFCNETVSLMNEIMSITPDYIRPVPGSWKRSS